MKKILYILSILFLSATLAGCDDMLDITPGSDMTDDNFWKSENDLKGACNRLYYNLEGWEHDARSDERVGRSPNSISNGSWTVPGESDDLKLPYDKICVANNIIEKGQDVPIDEDLRNRWAAEAYFFRAWHYFDLVRKYGDVPLVLKTFTSVYDPDLKQGRTPREAVIQQCYADLEFAAQHLPTRARWTTTDEFDRRRATRSAALGLMVRIGLFEGTMQKYHSLSAEATWKAHLKKAIDAFELLKAEGHALYSNFSGLFLPAGETNNPEILFAKAYGPNASPTTFHSYTRTEEGNYSLTRQMVDLFLYSDGLPREKTSKKIPLENSYNSIVGWEKNGAPRADGLGARDPRLGATVWLINDPKENDATVGWAVTGKGAYLPFDPQRPYGYPIKKAFVGSQWTSMKESTDKIHIRWGEMLISYAEALYEYNGSITDAQLDETVNALRNRVGFTAHLSNAFANTNGLNMRDEIRRERTVELMTEGFRYHDIIRWKIAEEVLPKAILGAKFVDEEPGNTTLRAEFTPNLTDAEGKIGGVTVCDYGEPDIYVIEKPSVRVFDPKKDYFYPIPTFEIAKSDGNFKQNPGWN
jgi:hypothetical protein